MTSDEAVIEQVCCICGARAVGDGSGLFFAYRKGQDPKHGFYCFCKLHENDAKKRLEQEWP